MTVLLEAKDTFSFEDFEKVVLKGDVLKASTKSKRKIERGFKELLRFLHIPGVSIYGIHTGFGALQFLQGFTHLGRHQRELVNTHACGVGDPLTQEEVRGMIYLRSLQLSQGYSCVKPSTFEKYASLLGEKSMPRIPSQGSVGASGDLVPLAHAAQAVFRNIPDDQIGPRDGLALINGTEASTSLSMIAALMARNLFERTCQVAALSFFAVEGKTEALDLRLVGLKRHPMSSEIANRLRYWLKDYKRGGLPQDPYSIRAIPQVLGCVFEMKEHAVEMLAREASSATDNPAFIFSGSTKKPAAMEVLHGANFHGIYAGVAADMLAWALHLLGEMSERRTDFLLSGARCAPKMLPTNNNSSGLMMTQVVQAALVAENRLYSHPASGGSIPTSANQEDVVPMSMGAAHKLKRVAWNYSRVLAVEALAGSRSVYLAKRSSELKGSTRLSALEQELASLSGGLVAKDKAGCSEAIEKIAEAFRSYDK